MPPAPADTSEQPTLRVMRLYKPRLDGRRVLPPCSVATASDPISSGSTTGEGDFALSSALKLPDSFGNIYLGETFTAYISVLNHMSTTVLVNASLSAKLQSPTGRADLEDRRTARGASVSRPNPAPLLSPSENLDMIVEHTLEELGTHTLRVTVKYHVAGDPEGSEPRSMRKFYRFSVMNPVSVNPVCTAMRGSPIVEVQLVNTTQARERERWQKNCMDLLLESCHFIPEGGVEASLLGGGEGGDPLAASPRDEDNETADTAEDGGARPPLQGGEAGSGGIRTSAATAKGARRRDRWWRGGGGNERGQSPGRGAGAEGKTPLDDDRCMLTAVERFDGRVLLRPEEGH
ncbi:unnamed protein product [Ectocarpus sp. 12 AP-2014]